MKLGSRAARGSYVRLMSVAICCLSLSGLLVFKTFAAPAITAPITSSLGTSIAPYWPDRLLVRFKSGVSVATINALQQGIGGAIDFQSRSVAGLNRVLLPPGTDMQAALNYFRANPNVAYVQPDFKIELYAPNDPYFPKQWSLHNTGQIVGYSSTSGKIDADINAPEAWDHAPSVMGPTAIVAVVDTGVQHDHRDLKENMWVNTREIPDDGIDNDNNGYVDDVHGVNTVNHSGEPMDSIGHGTHVAGIIAAVGDNALGTIGVAPRAKILACNFFGVLVAPGGSDSNAIACLDYVYEMKVRGENIVALNASWGGSFYSQALDDAIAKLASVGVLFVAAAGNSGSNNDEVAEFPANSTKPNVISVAASDENDRLTYFSSFGARSVHIAAPGWTTFSAIPTNDYHDLSGTSMAAPHVAGLAALMAGYDASRDWRAIKNLILAGGTSLPELQGKAATGRRVRAWDSDGTGSLSCVDQRVFSFLSPTVSEHTQYVGTTLKLRVLNINCDQPVGPVVVTTAGPAAISPLTLLDDGVAPDGAAGDGVYTGTWTAPSATGRYTLSVDGVAHQTIVVVDPSVASGRQSYLPPVQIAYNPRISSSASFTRVEFGESIKIDGGAAQCFNLNIGGMATPGPYYVSSFGLLSVEPLSVLREAAPIADAPSKKDNTIGKFPSTDFYSILAPYWGPSFLFFSHSGQPAGIRWWFDCDAPTPELIVQWRGVGLYSFSDIDIQMIFKAGSSDIEVQYIQVEPNNPWLSIGMQVEPTLARAQDSREVTAGTGWSWRIDTGPPTADAGTAQQANINSMVQLHGSGSDPDAGVLHFAWTQTGGTPVQMLDTHTAHPRFLAPATPDVLSFELTVTDIAGQTASSSTTVNVVDPGFPIRATLDALLVGVNENAGSISLRVSRVAGDSGALSVRYQTFSGSAQSGGDFTPVESTLSWADGDLASKTIVVPITDDLVVETTETFTLQLIGLDSAVYGTATITIYDNDSPGVLSLSSTTTSVLENAGSASISVARTGGSSGIVSVDYVVEAGTATAGSDFVAALGTLTWAQGDNRDKKIQVAIVDDALYERTESVRVRLRSETGGATLGVTVGDLFIVDDDAAPQGMLDFANPGITVNENSGAVTLIVTRSGGTSGVVSVSYATREDSATDGSDFTATAGTLTWADGDGANKYISIPIREDSVYEGDERFYVDLSNASSGAHIGTATAAIGIADNEPVPAGTLALTQSEFRAHEDAGKITITVRRSGGNRGAVSVAYSTGNGTAVAGSDFSAVMGTLRWEDGDTQDKSFEIPLIDDIFFERDENATVYLYDLVGATAGRLSAILAIADNDTPMPGALSFQVADVTVSEGGKRATVVVERAAGNNGDIQVEYHTADGSAKAGQDFVSATGVLNWADGDMTAKMFTIDILQDTLYEGSENARVELVNPTGGASIGNGVLSLVIVDDDPVNRAPTKPELMAPENGAGGVDASAVTFEWKPAQDPDGDAVRYALQYCTNEDFSGCDMQNTEALTVSAWALPASGGLGVMLVGMIATGSRRYRRMMGVGVVTAALIMSACAKNGNEGAASHKQLTVHALKSGTVYYWRVIVADGKGGENSSDTHRFTTGG